ncbi:GntR family transcriptional regulator [Primorskyibacter sp. 2E233]|uniref:GntR family transcriptional regulator n=1 Tax=Primorskyibacter sp. 2E233 TaxID=3413431 RepID=UPI003BF2901F
MELRAANWALDESLPITPQVHRMLRTAIIQGQLEPGNRISESEIAKTCNVSRQPVREAFIKLAGEGLLAVLPQRGTIISKIDYGAALDARFLREAIEADIIAILVRIPDAALIRDLRSQIDAQRAAANMPSAFIQLDEAFHRMLAEGAGKGGAFKLIEGLKSQMDRVRFLSLGQFPVDKLIAQHSALVDHIERGAAAQANTAIRTHLREILSDLPIVVAACPSFFNLPDGEIPTPVNAPIQGGEIK